MKTALSIAGSDPTSGAGVAADLITFNSLGVHGFYIITALTSQTLSKVVRIRVVDCEDFAVQMKTVFENFKINAAKTGVISTPCQARLTKEYVEKYNIPVIADPVFKASDGTVFSDEDTIRELVTGLYRKASLLTPNIIEAERLSDYQIRKIDDVLEASYILLKKGFKAVLIKGGHLNDSREVFDVLNIGGDVKIFRKNRLDWLKIHGSGCILSAAITAYTAQGYSIMEAVMRAEEYFSKIAHHPLNINSSVGLLQPFKMLTDCAEKIEIIKEMNQATGFLNEILKAGEWDIHGEIILLYSINKPVDASDVVYLKLLKEYPEKSLRLNYPVFGGDDLTSRILLAVKKFLPSTKVGLCLPYSETVFKGLEESGEYQYINLYFKEFSINESNLLEETFKNILGEQGNRRLDFLILFSHMKPVKIMVLGENGFNSIYKLAKILKKK